MGQSRKLYFQISLLYLYYVVAFVTSEDQNLRSTLGEYCDHRTRCDAKAALKCVLGKCLCARPDAMIFDNEKKKCLVMTGERCSYTAVEMGGTSQAKQWQEQVECVANAQCKADGFCNCETNFMEAVDGTCAPKRLFQEPCSSDSQCRTDKLLTCINGICTCNRTMRMFDRTRGKCVTLAGKIPDNTDPSCVTNARKTYDNLGCMCDSGYITSLDGLCLAPHHSECNGKDNHCDRETICKNGICLCRFSGQALEIANEKYNCVSKVNQPCYVTIKDTFFAEDEGKSIEIEYNCTKNAECKKIENIYECKCQKGFIEVNGECQLDHGEACGITDGVKCDEIRPLHCIDGICQCRIDMLEYFDEASSSCKGLVGAPCNLTTDIISNSVHLDATISFCTQGAHCEISRNRTSLRGHCRCSIGFKTTVNRKCVASCNEIAEMVSSNPVQTATTRRIKKCANANKGINKISPNVPKVVADTDENGDASHNIPNQDSGWWNGFLY